MLQFHRDVSQVELYRVVSTITFKSLVDHLAGFLVAALETAASVGVEEPVTNSV
mgnify:CR=1 FL=1